MLGDTDDTLPDITGDQSREAIDSLRGYVYQIYQSANAWLELESEEFLFLEVAEDYAVAASDALNAVQVKETANNVTINSDDIVSSIDSFVTLKQDNPDLDVRLHHLTTSKIGKEKYQKDRIGQIPTLDTWRILAKTGDLDPFRKILSSSKLSKRTKDYIHGLKDDEFRDGFLKKIHFDCGALKTEFVIRQLRSKLFTLIQQRGGVNSQVDDCLYRLLTILLYKSTQKEKRYVDRNKLEEILEEATQVPVNRAQLEIQTELVNKALSTTNNETTSLVSTRFIEPRPIEEVPLPAAIANRKTEVNNIITSLQLYGISWIFGSSGVGKTTGAKIAANRIGGTWASINLRGLNADQVNSLLSEIIDSLSNSRVDGLLVDDLECQFEPYIVDKLLYLFDIFKRSDLLLLFTSPREPDNHLLYSAELTKGINQKFSEFSENDISEILIGLNVDHTYWAKYIYLISGGGHPQLAIAAIQNMQFNHWDTNELSTLTSLVDGNADIEQVRSRTREKLLTDLPEGGRRLLERLSLNIGGFKRGLVLDLGQIEPKVHDSGIIFDRLIGSWVDQQALDSFSLSPLLFNFAAKTLSDQQKQEISFDIANILIKGQSLDPIEMNSALYVAWSGENHIVVMKICMAFINLGTKDLKIITPHLIMLRYMRTDAPACKENHGVNQMFRGAQLVLVAHEEEGKERFKEVLKCFETESKLVECEVTRSMMTVIVFSKLLMSDLEFSLLPEYAYFFYELEQILENKNSSIPSDILEAITIIPELDNDSTIGFLFLYQSQRIKLIEDLIPTFEFLDECGEDFRQKLLATFSNHKLGFELDFLVTGAWLAEDKLNTIDPALHSEIFSRLEDFATDWGRTDIAVCCRKFRIIIIDEYGNDKELALKVIEEGLNLYGEINSELIRSKTKVLYRAEDHQSSLELAKSLIENDVSLNDIEKAYLGREAAISAEKQGDYEVARKYYLYAKDAASTSDLAEMKVMSVGLLADAALASWHSSDYETCILDLMTVLTDLNDIDPQSSLRAIHCHAITRHVLLWLDGDVTKRKILLEGDEELGIYPGIVSNTEPCKDIENQTITAIEIAWYMLARVENLTCLNVGLNKKLVEFLPNGKTVIEGQMLLAPSKMRKAFVTLEAKYFIESLEEIIALTAYSPEQSEIKNNLDENNISYGTFPIPSFEQQTRFINVTERYAVIFMTICLYKNKVDELDQLVSYLATNKKIKVRNELIDCLDGKGTAIDHITYTAQLYNDHSRAISEFRPIIPGQIYDLAFRIFQLSRDLYDTNFLAKMIFDWLYKKWVFIWENQSFLLRSPNLHIRPITAAFEGEGDSDKDLIVLLQAILPTMGFENESSYREELNKYTQSDI